MFSRFGAAWAWLDADRRSGLTLALGLLVAALAQRTFDATPPSLAELTPLPRDLTGAALLLVGMLLFAHAAPAPAAVKALRRRELPPDPSFSGGRWTVWTLLALALALGTAAAVRFGLRGEDAAVRLLWVASMLAFLGHALEMPLRSSPLAASPPFRRSHLALLAIVLVVGFGLRFYRLDSIPLDFHGDTASIGLQARDMLLGVDTQIFRTGWADIPRLGFYPSMLSMKLFGITLFGLDMSGVVDGMAMLIGTYLLGWRLFDSHRVGLLATAVLAITVPHVHFSRIAQYADPWPWMVFAAVLVVDGLRARRRASLALAGVLLGVGLQMYYSSRSMLLILGLWLLLMVGFRLSWLRGRLVGTVLLVVGALVVIGPLAVFFARNPGPLFQRTREVYLFEPDVMTHSKAKYRVETDEEVVVEQLKRSLLTFNFYADSSTQFGYRYPMFVSALAVCVMLGVGYCLRHWRHPGAGLVAIWTLVTLLIGSALTVDAPFWPRLVGVLPAAALAAGLAIDRVWALLEGEARAARRAVSRLAAVAATGLLVWSGVDGWQRYLESVEHFVRPQAQLGRYLSSLPREVVACNLGGPLELKVRETAFLAWPRPLVELMPGGRAALAECPGPPFVWVLDARTEALLPRLREQWPGGAVVRHRNADGQPVFTTFEVR